MNNKTTPRLAGKERRPGPAPAFSRGRGLLLPLAALVIFLTTGCDERSFGPLTRPVKENNDSAPVRPSVPTLAVGNVNMPMPVPGGFRRIPAEDPLMSGVQAGLDSEEILLCLFGKAEEEAAPPPENPLNQDTLQVSTLRKWLHAQISFQDFMQLKKPWQDESVVFNQKTLAFFEKATQSYLREQNGFTYNLGLIDSGPAHISFLKVIKYGAPGKEPVYVCNTTSLLWSHGKILRIAYNRRLADFSQIQEVVAESVGYLQKIQDSGRLEAERAS
ncbi:MAG: hypothetical protein LBQ63_07935 [Deltaproteobacteria bacterium]|jgi:hypothetical protein|nr:hypothetical protein [Deltaproteobacteria bacterium]